MGTAETILRLLDMFQQGVMTVERINIIRNRINAMKQDGRDPSVEEWTSLFDSVHQQADRLHEAAGSAR